MPKTDKKRILERIRKKSLTVDEALSKGPQKRRQPEEISTLAITILVIIGLSLVGAYIGLVSYHEGKGGFIYGIDLLFKRPSFHWAGIYGAAFGVGVTSSWEFNITPGSMNEENLFFQCFEKGTIHEVYATRVPQASIDINSLRGATLQEINDFLGTNATDYDAAENTITSTMDVEIGPTLIQNVPSTYTSVGNGTNATQFDVGYMIENNINHNMVIVSHVADTLYRGFNNRFYNYQMLLPMFSNQTTFYYVWSDPYDVCLGGNESTAEKGVVQGYVTDVSGNPLQDVIVVVGPDSTVSDASGFYNITTDAGVHFIIAIKTGYQVYQNNVTVVANEFTQHNIVLELVVVPNPNTDIGPDYNPDIGPSDNTNVDIGPGEVQPVEENPQVIEGQDFVILLTEIRRRMREGEFTQAEVQVVSYREGTIQLNFKTEGNVTQMTTIDRNTLLVDPKATGRVILTFYGNITPGDYNGTLNITGDVNANVPIYIELLSKEKMPIQTMLIGLSLADKTIYQGSTLTFRTDLTNLLTDQEYPVQLFYTIQDLEGKNTVWTYSTNVFLKTSLSIIKNVELPQDLPPGDYILRVSASYMGMSSSNSIVFPVNLPFFQTLLFGKVRMWQALLGLLLLLLLILAYILIKRNIESKKKYHLKIELNEIPKPGPRSIWVGKLAETDHKTYMNMENFKTHTIVAGSTGGGKSFSAQVIIEEMLMKDTAIIVFDPTAQWTGMLRKLQNKGLLALYPNFGMKESDARTFTGNIRQINNPRELIDIKKFMKPGEIQIFACHKLDPKDIDMFVANTVREVFHANFEESEPLRLMLVYDEVHRLLPKFGGSGEGFLQIERACREFRKWGIGVMLISQVLADFVGQIKANINTEVQMRTRDEGDLDRIKTKYGPEVLMSLVKASVGTGMVQNAAYNRGRPYFVTFRPIMHSVTRLTDEEIEQYNKYNERIDQLAYEINQLEELKMDVFDLRLELKLALDKVKAGNFNMVSIYLEGLEPRIKKAWEKFGKEPKKLQIRMVSEEQLKAELDKAKAERAKFEADNKVNQGPAGDQKEDIVTKFKKDVPPDKIFHLHNDMLVVNPKSLYTEIEAMKDSDFAFHVTDAKNDFADWIRKAVGDDELADLMASTKDKKEIMKFLDMREKGQKMPPAPKKAAPAASAPAPAPTQAATEPAPVSAPSEHLAQTSQPEIKIEIKPEEKRTEEQKNPEEIKKVFEEFSQPIGDAEDIKITNEEQVKDDKKKDMSPGKEIIEREAPSGQYFRLENGAELKSLKDLLNYLPNMPEDIFKNHVNSSKNDFASWVRGVFHEDDLANRIAQAQTKQGIEEVLSIA